MRPDVEKLVKALEENGVQAAASGPHEDVRASWCLRSARVALVGSWWCLMDTVEWPTGAHLYPRGMEEVTAVYVARRLKGTAPEVEAWHEALSAAVRPRRPEVPRPRPAERSPLPRRDSGIRYWPRSFAAERNGS